jgi:LacI family transcriptional regulator
MNPAFVEYLVIGKDERPGFQHGRDAILKMMTRESLPSALFLTNDVVALGAMEVLKQAGLRIPEDVSIIGCDDIDLYGQADPPLTTICTDLEEFGAVGVQRLFALMEAPDQPSQIIKVPLQLVIRGSAAQRAKRSPRAPKEGTR